MPCPRSFRLAALTCTIWLLAAAVPAGAGPLDEARALAGAGDFAKAIEIIRPAAEAGNPDAQAFLGEAYATGQGVRRDPALALKWLKPPADQGHAGAMLALGRLLIEGGGGIEQDYLTAAEMFTTLMKRGEAEAFTEYGRMLEMGLMGVDGAAEAARIWQKGAALGSAASAWLLGGLYREGRGVEEDHAKARALFGEAARAGHGAAMVSLGEMHEAGEGGAADPVAAHALYRLAASRGVARAAYDLAFLAAEKEGFWQDPVRARAWCLKALSMAGDEEREEYEFDCAGLAEYLTPEEEAAAAALAEKL